MEWNHRYTRAAGVMCAEGLLRNPLLFSAAPELQPQPTPRQLGEVCLEYLELAEQYPPPDMSLVRGHLMWILGKSGKGHRCKFPPEHLGPFSSEQLRMALVECGTVDGFRQLVLGTLLHDAPGLAAGRVGTATASA